MGITNKLENIANAIRKKNGTTDTMTLEDMAIAISNLSVGGMDENITENKLVMGTFELTEQATTYQVVFDTPLDSQPIFAMFWEQTDEYVDRARTKGGMSVDHDSMIKCFLSHGLDANKRDITAYNMYSSSTTNGTTVRPVPYDSNTKMDLKWDSSRYGISYPSVRNATRLGMKCYSASSSFILIGKYFYMAVCE